MTNKYEIGKYLTVSSVHITEEEANMLEDSSFVEKDDYSFRLFTCLGDRFSEIDQIIREDFNDSNNLRDLIDLARQLDCVYLVIDGDGPILEDYETYDW